VSLYSWDYEPKHAADEWFWMAHAYADASVALFEGMVASRLTPTFHHAKVAAAAFDHGLELFLKACLVRAGERPARTHSMATILQRFRARYPGDTYAFSGRIDEAVRDLAIQPAGQFLRYPVDRKGVPWPGHSHFDLELWLGQVRAFRDDYRRLEPLVKEARRLTRG
jgi:hypothetical protein